MKSKGVAYLLWLGTFVGLAGLHRFYLGKIGTGLLWLFTFGIGGIGTLIDLFTLGGQVEQVNQREQIKDLSVMSALQAGAIQRQHTAAQYATPQPAIPIAEPKPASAQDVRAFMDSLVEMGLISDGERVTASALWVNDDHFKQRAKRVAAMPPSDVRASEARRLAHYVRESKQVTLDD